MSLIIDENADIAAAIEATIAKLDEVKQEIGRVIFGQEGVVEDTLITLLAGGHALLVGVPGLAKTRLAETLGVVLGLAQKRVQFTPDLMPADILGSEVLDDAGTGRQSFRFIPGPIFAQLLMADEINRASPRTQAALLQAMQERKVTVAGHDHALPVPFHVLATQNPIEQEGTYPLPEAQIDRFLLKVKIGYPTKDEEQEIIRRNLSGEEWMAVKPVVTPGEILRARQMLQKIYMDEKIERYILDIVFATRQPAEAGLRQLVPLIQYGGSPRASISLALAAKAQAFLKKRGYVIPDDVRSVCHDVLRHRIGLTYEAEAENITQEEIIARIINTVSVP